MDYITTKEAAQKWSISGRRVLQYCNAKRINGAVKMGNTWLIPKSDKDRQMVAKRILTLKHNRLFKYLKG